MLEKITRIKSELLSSLKNFDIIIFIQLNKKILAVFFVSIIISSAVFAFYNAKLVELTLSYDEVLMLYNNESNKTQELSVKLKSLETDNSQLEMQMKIITLRTEAQVQECEDKFIHLGLYDTGAPLIVSADIEREFIDFIVKHFNAMYSGDVETYKETLSPEVWQSDYMMEKVLRFVDETYYHAEVKIIPYFGHGYIPIYILVQKDEDSEPEIQVYNTGIYYTDGEVGVYDYD